MTQHQALALALIGGMLALFLWDRLRYDMVALIALLAAIAVGIVPFDKAFSGFGNSLLPLIASALVVSAAVDRSGVVQAVLQPLRWLMRSPSLEVAALVTAVAFFSAVIKNIGALAIFLPIAMQTAKRSDRSVSELLMPLSFASLVGGMMTLIGTSPNLIISSIRQELTGAPYSMFAFTPVGLGITLIGILFLSFGWRLIPVRRKIQDGADMPFHLEDYLSEAKLPATSSVVGKTVGELESLSDGDITVTAIIREGNRRYVPSSNWVLFAGDVVVLESDPHSLDKFVATAQLELIGSEDIREEGTNPTDIDVVEAVIKANSRMIGASPIMLRLRERFGVNLLAVSRGGKRNRARLHDVLFEEGDVVVLQGRAGTMPDTLASLGCLPLAGRNLQLGRPRKVWPPLAILALCVALSATEYVPAPIAFMTGAVLIGLFRVLSLQEIYDAIDWPILILLGSLIPVGEAVRDTGTTDLIAGWLSGVSSLIPVPGMLAMLLVITMALTPLLHHAAAVIVMGPVAASLARRLGLHIDPFLMVVAVGASCDFLSPIGHQCNALVMGPGEYRFADYWRLGLPLSLLVVVLGVPLILLFWPLR